jgi:outer membrane receptor for ferrienterochelin and colicin
MALASAHAIAQTQALETHVQLDEISVHEAYQAVQGRMRSRDAIQKEVVSKSVIEKKAAQTLADALDNETGVDTQNSCANCGSKRITVNGLRGEHTTVMIDGMPMYSTVSSIYGMDAVPVVGISELEITRGAGQSLIAPEAIGGAVNLVTVGATHDHLELQTRFGEYGNRNLSLLGTIVGDTLKNRGVVALQWSGQNSFDGAGNGVATSPESSTLALFAKAGRDFTSRDHLELRYGRQQLFLLGGNTTGYEPSTYQKGVLTAPRFANNDVRQAYLDDPARITDLVRLQRNEGSMRYSHDFSTAQLQSTFSVAHQTQNSIYMHGYDYDNRSVVLFGDVRGLMQVGSDHMFTVGADARRETLRSQSERLYEQMGLPRDDLNASTLGGYIQESWNPRADLELVGAVRVDHLRVRWTDTGIQTSGVTSTLLSPRANLRWEPHKGLVSRLSYGRGYRTPLSFFESQHGLSENGFVSAITKPERSHGMGYAFTVDRSLVTVTASTHYNILQNMAYADEGDGSGPARFVNYDNDLGLWTNDIVCDVKLGAGVTIFGGYERFTMPGEYKKRLPVAAIEERGRVGMDWQGRRHQIGIQVNMIGARDLEPYGYGQHFATYQSTPADPDFPEFGTVDVVNEPKWRRAPFFATVDLSGRYKISENIQLEASVTNLFDITQAKKGDSPLNWRQHGANAGHFHFDNNHIWGPLRGRVATVGITAAL